MESDGPGVIAPDAHAVSTAPPVARNADAAVVEFRHVTKVYRNGVHALNDVNLLITSGEFVFVVGPTGTGKSTLTKMIYREEVPTSGHVFVGGRDVTRMPSRQVPFLRRRVGVVFQETRLLPLKTAWENVAFALEVTGTPPRETDARVGEVLEVVGLGARAGALPGELSGGEQQRVSIARALVHRPPLLVADEPTGSLDPETAWEIVQLLSRIHLEGTTVIVTTHDKTIVDILRKRVVALDRGTIVRDEARGLYAGGH